MKKEQFEASFAAAMAAPDRRQALIKLKNELEVNITQIKAGLLGHRPNTPKELRDKVKMAILYAGRQITQVTNELQLLNIETKEQTGRLSQFFKAAKEVLTEKQFQKVAEAAGVAVQETTVTPEVVEGV